MSPLSATEDESSVEFSYGKNYLNAAATKKVEMEAKSSSYLMAVSYKSMVARLAKEDMVVVVVMVVEKDLNTWATLLTRWSTSTRHNGFIKLS
ncbi:hypothetical protein JCGZ_08328 [Jatropha curcas]|uniref:Uncharacterized protein n=1 Tax=Jatropha curcas TaxID=180498 RepID=A0A067KJZ0_JATCU|nr:hypothetical protein JCGZ_08328 [Jatropha curcas]